MMKQMVSKVTPKWVMSIMIILFVMIGLIFTNLIKQTALSQQKAFLENEITLITPLIFDGSKLAIDSDKLSQFMRQKQQLIVFNADGTIQYDSLSQNSPIRKLDTDSLNQLNTDKEIVFSINKEKHSMELSKAIYVKSELIGIIRISKPDADFLSYIRITNWSVFVFLFLISLIMGAIYFYLTLKNRQAIRLTNSLLKKSIAHREDKPIIVDAPNGWHQLYQTINELINKAQLLSKQHQKDKEHIESLFEQSKVGIFIVKADLEIVFTNSVIKNLFEFNQDDNDTVYLFKHKKLIRFIQEAVATKQKISSNIQLTDKNIQELNVTIEPSKSNQEEYIGIVYDVSEIRQMEQLHADFISNISHELKTPTTSIIGFSETLLAGAKDDPETAEAFIRIIEKESRRLLTLIQTILSLLKTEKDVYLTETKTTNPVEVVKEEIERYLPKAQEKKITLNFDSHLIQDIELPTNAFQLIVKNLLENAVEYTHDNGSVTIYLQEVRQELILIIEDSGIGISKEDQKRVFERFYRVSQSRQRHTGGSGLGLSIVWHYTQILGGHIKLQSEVNEGTTVIVKIPIP